MLHELAPLHRMVHWGTLLSPLSSLAARIASQELFALAKVFGRVACSAHLPTLLPHFACSSPSKTTLAARSEVFAAFNKLRTMAHNPPLPSGQVCRTLATARPRQLPDFAQQHGCWRRRRLGTAVGNVPAKISEWVRDKVESWRPHFETSSPQLFLPKSSSS